MQFEEKKEERISRFNLAQEWLRSLRSLLDDCNELSRTAYIDYDINILKQWKFTLMGVLREVSIKLKEVEINTVQKELNETNIKLTKAERTPEGKHLITDREAFIKVAGKLHSIEIKLRQLADQRGLGLPEKQSALEGMD